MCTSIPRRDVHFLTWVDLDLYPPLQVHWARLSSSALCPLSYNTLLRWNIDADHRQLSNLPGREEGGRI